MQNISQVSKIMFKQCCFNAFYKHWKNTLTICLKVHLLTRGIFHWGFPETLFHYGHCIQAVTVFHWFFLQPTQRTSLYYFRRINTMWFLPHLFCRHDLFTKNFVQYIFSSKQVCMTIIQETAINNGQKFCTKRELFADQ